MGFDWQTLFEWLHLFGRWLHITVAITWIGTSIFFMWLDRSFEPDPNSSQQGLTGRLWMVHGGGFYKVEKMKVGSIEVPEHLHWFKWESYWTWMSGMFLLLLIFYTGGGTFLLDPAISQVSFSKALMIGIFSIFGSWFFYDFLWERSVVQKNLIVGHGLTLIWLAGMSYFLCETLSGRAAFIHIGAMLGTWMTANVFLRIIPRQVKMIEAAKNNQPINQDWALNAKSRSTHNTYFTLPVILIMLSNHFPLTYGHSYNWLILLLMMTAGASIRHFFIVRLSNPRLARIFLGLGLMFFLLVFLVAQLKGSQGKSLGPLIPTEISENSKDYGKKLNPLHNLKGTVKFNDVAPAPIKMNIPVSCKSNPDLEIFSDELVVRGGRLKNVLVRVTRGLEGQIFSDIPSETAVVDQRDCVYHPRVIAVRKGQKLEFVNSDPVFHNVRSVTEKNEVFNVAMPQKNERIVKVFTAPEIFMLAKCDIHPWMKAMIAVIDHPFFMVSNDEGEFSFGPLKPGKYTIEAIHETLGTKQTEVEITANQDFAMEFTFSNSKENQ